MRRVILIIFFVLLACYALFQARFVIFGPRLNIETPKDNSTASSSLVLVSGTAMNVSYLSLDGRQIYTDTSGHFSEQLLAPSGVSTIDLVAEDRFGRKAEKLVHIVFNNQTQ